MKRVMVLFGTLLLLGTMTAFAQEANETGSKGAEAKEAPAAKDPMAEFKKFAAMGDGVYRVKYDEDGQIKSCIVVGSSRVSTVLGASKGKQTARRKADLACDAEFVKWCKAKLTVEESDSGEDIFVLSGSGKDDDSEKESMTEEGKSTEAYTRKVTRYAEGILRGMEVLFVDTDAAGKTVTVVKGLNAKNIDAVKDLSKKLNSDDTPAAETGSTGAVEKGPEAPKGKTKLKSESAVAPGAEEFL